jgi:hypothetical protein
LQPLCFSLIERQVPKKYGIKNAKAVSVILL